MAHPARQPRVGACAGVTRRTAALLPLALLAPAPAAAATVGLPNPASLAVALDAALRARRPLVVMTSLEGCPYCTLVRSNYLVQLHRNQAQPVVQLELGVQRPVLDFEARATTHELVLRRWGVQVAPTLLFFGRGGREIAERLVGAPVDFYGAYLEQRLAAAHRSLG